MYDDLHLQQARISSGNLSKRNCTSCMNLLSHMLLGKCYLVSSCCSAHLQCLAHIQVHGAAARLPVEAGP
jgi:hypothetical protein